MKKFELLAATAFSLFVAAPAMAQDAPAQDTQVTQDSDEIVVTATKRETTLLDTPIAVSVTNADTIERAQIRDLIDLQSVVPSLRVSQLQSSANTNFIIRGFGNGANNAGIEPSVGVFIDGVYRSRSAAQIADLPNLERVEVLRGPQSTLFGKNASAGIISIVTARPKFEFGGNVEASYGNYNAIVLKGNVTGPLSDTVAFSLGGNYNKRDGYVRDVALNKDVNNRNRWGVRGQLLFEPNSDFSIRLIGDYDKIDENCCAVANVINGPTGAIIAALGGNLDRANPFSYRVYNNILSSNKIDNYGGSGEINYALGDGLSLTSITSYRKVKALTDQDSDFTSADLIGHNAQQLDIGTFTQEFRVASDFDGPINFLVGGFFFDERIKQANQINFGAHFRPYGDQLIRAASGNALNVALLESTFGALEGAPARYTNAFFRRGDGLNENYRMHDRSFSLFGTVDFEVTDKITLTGGLNYTDDRKRFSTNVISTDAFAGINLDAPQYAPFRNTLLFQGGLAAQIGTALGLGRSATAAEIGAFAGANPAAYGAISTAVQAYATANQNNAAANPLAGLRALQFLPPFLNVPNSVEPGRTHDSNLSYTLRAAYKANNNLNFYATYATGFKASSVNLSRDSRPTIADLALIRSAGFATVNLGSGSRFAGPEKASVYEVGMKASYQRFAFNAAVFKQYILGFQSNVFTGTGFSLLNAPKESVFGVELDTSVTPVDALNLTFAVTYLDPKYDSFAGGGAIGGANLSVVPTNLTGTRPAGIPEFTLSSGINFTQSLGESATLLLHADFDHSSPVQIAEGVITTKRTINMLNLSAGIRLDNGLELSVWGRNVTNDKYLSTIFSSVAQAGSISGYPSMPRTYGVTGRFGF
ncbi:TonB-dependent receptor domain-containing protein [Sphingomonas soli]|uniref:TonB-dependent receptor domain-containing protein n=1 Tax=Sphingomonas soli TaxID=266127 RepID=UPI00082E80D6|nr:TonB-dependent receptor [Sphingomonas soli]